MTTSRFASRRQALVLGAGLLGAGALASMPYGSGARASTLPPYKGPLPSNLSVWDEPLKAPAGRFSDADGEALELGDFAGRALVVNFWATWCAPCVREMPSLDRLQAETAEDGVAVLAISNDRGGLNQVLPFFAERDLKHLEIYIDADMSFARAMAVRALPTTLILEPGGRIVASAEGSLEWDSAEVIEMLRYYAPLDPPAPERLGESSDT